MKQYVVDAFSERVFGGNQAAVCVLDAWPPDALMQSVAKENLFSETAFAVREGDAYRLRWFTPAGEIDFCGHATLGASFVLFRFYEKDAPSITFVTQVGKLAVERRGDWIVMDFPAYRCNPVPVTDAMADAIGVRPLEAYLDRDLLLVLPDAGTVRTLRPDQKRMKALDGLLVAVTAAGDVPGCDCVSRVFAPKCNVAEDPVTGSAHCMIAPYWCGRLGKESLVCRQASERGGVLHATRVGDRVRIAGTAALYSEGEILCSGVSGV